MLHAAATGDMKIYKSSLKSKCHCQNSKAGHEERHGNESGNVTGKCGHDQLL